MESLFQEIIRLYEKIFMENDQNAPLQPQPSQTGPSATVTPSSTVAPQNTQNSPTTAPKPPFSIPEIFINAIIMQESGGDDSAIGDKGLANEAYGPMQIRQPVCIDVNRNFGLNLQAEQMLNNRPLSIDTFTKYMEIYCKGGSFEDMARTWNGGPGWKVRPNLTNAYWAGVQRYL